VASARATPASYMAPNALLPIDKLAQLRSLLARRVEPPKVGLQIAGSLIAASTASSAQWASCASAGAAAAAAGAAVAAGKAYAVKPSLLDPFAPMVLAQVLLLGVALPFQLQLDAAMKRFEPAKRNGGELGVTHDEDGKQLTPFHLIDTEKMKIECIYNCGKSLTNKMLLKAVHLALWNALDGEQGQHRIAKIIKDVAASAVRHLPAPPSLSVSLCYPTLPARAPCLRGLTSRLLICVSAAAAFRSARLCVPPRAAAATSRPHRRSASPTSMPLS
jgi:hypothetical protein